MKPTNVLFAVVAHPPCLACALPTQSIACVVHTVATRIPAVLTVVTRITCYKTNSGERILNISSCISCLSQKSDPVHNILVLHSGGFFPAGHSGQSIVWSSHDSVTKPHNLITLPEQCEILNIQGKTMTPFFASTSCPTQSKLPFLLLLWLYHMTLPFQSLNLNWTSEVSRHKVYNSCKTILTWRPLRAQHG